MASTVGSLPRAQGPFRERFRDRLLDARSSDVAAGYELARTLGPAAADLLWDLHDSERSYEKRRTIVLLAALLADGPGADERAFRALQRAQPMEPMMACLYWALGPRHETARPDFWTDVMGRKTTEVGPLWTVAALLASARFPEAPASIPIGRDEQDPGIVAAAAFAGAPVPDSVLARFLKFDGDAPRHAELVWRGHLLGALLRSATAIDAAVVQRARTIQAMPGDLPPHRLVAASLLARAGQQRATGPRPPWQLLQAMVLDTATAALVADWLHPGLARPGEDPKRLAVGYALGQPVRTLVEQRTAWAERADIRQHVTLALAWRLLDEADVPAIDWTLPAVPEWFFVRFASGARVQLEGTIADPVLQQAALLAQDDRIARPVLREVLEQWLWRHGSHPGLSLFEAEQALVRDLLLTGTNWGNKYAPGVPPHELYFATGRDRSDLSFEVAVQAYDYLSRPTLPIPRHCRLH